MIHNGKPLLVKLDQWVIQGQQAQWVQLVQWVHREMKVLQDHKESKVFRVLREQQDQQV
jgi:hypothetical protein